MNRVNAVFDRLTGESEARGTLQAIDKGCLKVTKDWIRYLS